MTLPATDPMTGCRIVERTPAANVTLLASDAGGELRVNFDGRELTLTHLVDGSNQVGQLKGAEWIRLTEVVLDQEKAYHLAHAILNALPHGWTT